MEIINRTNISNGFELKSVNDLLNEILISFEFVNPNDGILINILHNSESKKPSSFGSIIGSKTGLKNYGNISFMQYAPRKKDGSVYESIRHALVPSSRFASLFMITFGFLMNLPLFSPELAKIITDFDNKTKIASPEIFIAITGILYIGIGGFLYWMSRKRFPGVLSPETQNYESTTQMDGAQAHSQENSLTSKPA
jgi:hypothetical protein